MKKGVVHIYTGDGKGKTTASLGVCLRAAGYGLKSCIIQFVKGTWHTGERDSIPVLLNPHVTIYSSGKGFVGILDDKYPLETHQREAYKALHLAREQMQDPELHLLVLDEVNVAITLNLIRVEDVVELLKQKPERLNIILTGRGAPQQLCEMADLVTEMKPLKHYFDKGETGRKGIEF